MPDVGIDKLGSFPILQFAAALMMVAFGGLAIWRAVVGKPTATPAVPEQRWYFEGPIAEIFKQLARINQVQERAVERHERMITLIERGNESLEEISRNTRDIADAPRRK